MTKGERREAKREKQRYGPIRNMPPGESRKTTLKNVRVRINGKEVKYEQ
jgi:hypothetical protein